MTCPRCQQDNPSHARFCLGCGARLAPACGACGAELPGGARFCLQCGQAVAGTAAAPIRSATPETYTPKHLAEKILTSKAALEGERKQVTVLFADLKGSMELLADRDPEEARKLLDPVLEHMMEAVHRYEGTVNQVMGDGIMALFGAPLAHEDHAIRACYAALRMQETVKQYADGVRRQHGVTIRIRVGLNSGEVVVRAIGSDLHMDYTAVGQTTHLAARMEQLADPGSILLTPETLELAEGFVQVSALGLVAVRGLSVPIEVYELTGVSAVRSRLQAAAARGLSRFVGRDTEMEHLRRTLDQARQGRGQLATLIGEPGVGKSRIVFELTRSHRVGEWMVLEAGSVSYGKATSYLPVIELLKAYFRIDDRDTYRHIREKVTGKLLTLDRALEPALPALLSLLDAPVDDSQWAALDPSQRRQRTLEAIKRLLLRETQAQPVLLVVEDLHWIDSETQAFLDSLVETLPTARVLLLVSYRPEYRHGWGQKMYYSQLRLDPLPPETAGELLEALLGPDASLQSLKMSLAQTTGGNPLFLEESVRTLVETRALRGNRGAYHLAQPVETVQVPSTVQAILAARIDRLRAEDKRLLETAAVIGKDFAFTVLQSVAEETEPTLRAGLDRLQATEFVYQTSLFPDLEYTFKHALTHDVAYGTVLHERRRVLHARIVEAIERLYADRLVEHVERLAYHAVRGEMWETALRYLQEAGAKAMARSAYREAVATLELGLNALSHLPDTSETRIRGVDLRLALKDALSLLGQLDLALMHLRDAEVLARHLDPIRQAWVAAGLSYYSWVTDRATEAWMWGERARALAEAQGDHTIRVATTHILGTAAMTKGDHRRAVELFRDTLSQIRPGEERERFGLIGFPGAMARVYLAYALGKLGDFAEATAQGREALHFAALLDHPHTQVAAEWRLAHTFVRKGDGESALALAASAVARAQQWELHVQLPLAEAVQGFALVVANRSDGVPVLERALATMETLGDRYTHLEAAGLVAEGYLLAGRWREARMTAATLIARAGAQGKPDMEAYARYIRGEVSRCEGDQRAAQEWLDAALTHATDLGMRPLVAHCHLGLGTLCRRTGDGAKAAEHLTTAATMYREMGMAFWLEKADAELGGVER